VFARHRLCVCVSVYARKSDACQTGHVFVLARSIPLTRVGLLLQGLLSHARLSCSPLSVYVRSTNKMAIASDRMIFYYMARDNLCFLTLCEEAYPKRLAFLYLDEIADLILQELLQEYGSNVRSSSVWLEKTSRSL
jgi:Regulated-SNARE-like domain